jgi:hypothetical protein
MPDASNPEYSKEDPPASLNRPPTQARDDPNGQSQTLPHTFRQLLPVKFMLGGN